MRSDPELIVYSIILLYKKSLKDRMGFGEGKENFFRNFPSLPQENLRVPPLSPREFFYDFDGYALDGEVAADHAQFF